MSDHYNPNSPAGQVEQMSNFAAGLIRLTGWRRTLARVLVLALLVLPLVVLVVAHIP